MLTNEVDVSYWLTADLDPIAVGALGDRLSEEERQRCARFVFPRDRRDFAAAHALLRNRLSAHADHAPHEWAFVAGPYGKPAMGPEMASPLSFNLAHTHGLVACAITAERDIGIDVERIDRRVAALEMARRFFSPIEIAQVERCGDESRRLRFVEIWTLKEAYVKACGSGLSHPLETFGFSIEGSRGIRFHPGNDARAWSFAMFAPSPGHRLAVAVAGPPPSLCALSVCDARLTVRAGCPPIRSTS